MKNRDVGESDGCREGVNPATGATLFTRPMCVHPQFLKYTGIGDVNSADSYTCSVG